MGTLNFCILFSILAFSLCNSCAAEEDIRPKRILLEDNYYTIVNKLDTLSKKIENMEAENAVLNQQLNKVGNLSRKVETLETENAVLNQQLNKVDNLSRKVETLETENAVLNKKIRDLQTVKHVAFKASLTTSITGTQKRIIIFDHVELNIGNAYNVLHGNFIAPVNGTYLFSIYACSAGGHYKDLKFMRNGSVIDNLRAGDTVYDECSSNTFVLELNQGDDIYVSEGNYGDSLYAAAHLGYPHFSGVLLNTN